MKVAITPEMRKRIKDLAEQHGLDFICLFGSQATGKTHTESDVDIAVHAERELTEPDLVNLSYELANIIKIDRVDIVSLFRTSPLLKRRIADEAVVLYDRTGHAFAAFEIAAIRRYAEAQPLFAMREEKLRAFLQPL